MFYKLKKKKKRKLPISFRLPAMKAVTTPVLAQVIGQFGFNMQDFLVMFNKKSGIFIEGTTIKTLLYLLPNKKWKIVLPMVTYIQSIKMVADITTMSRHAKIVYSWERKLNKYTQTYRYKKKQRKHWRGKITLRHIYTILELLNNLENYNQQLYKLPIFDKIKTIIHTLHSTGLYISKI